MFVQIVNRIVLFPTSLLKISMVENVGQRDAPAIGSGIMTRTCSLMASTRRLHIIYATLLLIADIWFSPQQESVDVFIMVEPMGLGLARVPAEDGVTTGKSRFGVLPEYCKHIPEHSLVLFVSFERGRVYKKISAETSSARRLLQIHPQRQVE
jgi:hypothetical protein